jgi:hypothetical protein
MRVRTELAPTFSSEELIVQFIRLRRIRHEALMSQGRVPRLIMTPVLAALFETPALWITVDGIRYVPDTVIKSLLVRNDGVPISQNRKDQDVFSVSVAMRKRTVERRYGIRPLAAQEKKRHQFWDEPFVRAFLASLQDDKRNCFKNVNKVAYNIRDSVDASELFELTTQARNKVVETIRFSRHPFYEVLRQAQSR